jgi:hypothetical protein
VARVARRSERVRPGARGGNQKDWDALESPELTSERRQAPMCQPVNVSVRRLVCRVHSFTIRDAYPLRRARGAYSIGSTSREGT